jgi:hypothetical protein
MLPFSREEPVMIGKHSTKFPFVFGGYLHSRISMFVLSYILIHYVRLSVCLTGVLGGGGGKGR